MAGRWGNRLGMLFCVLAHVRAVSALAGTINRAAELELEPSIVGVASAVDAAAADDPTDAYRCDEGVRAAGEQWAVAGTNLGGWLVLEPWITPSLFYQFLSDRQLPHEIPQRTAMDQFTFCAALGPDEGNRQLRRHWSAWVREEDIRAIAETGANTVRIPVGDWMYVPYGPYVGCTEGSLSELDRALSLLRKYNLRAILDVHAIIGSQNGFDNSGQAKRIRWTLVSAQEPAPVVMFEHWPIRSADWLGMFDVTHHSYSQLNKTAMEHSLKVIQRLVERHKTDPTVWGVTPVNEPWQHIPLEWLKDFYWRAYNLVRKQAPHWTFVMHDGFRGYPSAWRGFMSGCPNKAMDAHVYQAWNRPTYAQPFFDIACRVNESIRAMEDEADMPIIVGEWSLATDNCAMWLNGFNDNLPGFPKVFCAMVDCPAPYMGTEQPAAPPDPDLPLQGPFGSGVSGPMFGKCPVGMQWGSQEFAMMHTLAHKLVHSFSHGHGHLFWNFRTELERRWSFLEAWRAGWLPRNISDAAHPAVAKACDEPGTLDGRNRVIDPRTRNHYIEAPQLAAAPHGGEDTAASMVAIAGRARAKSTAGALVAIHESAAPLVKADDGRGVERASPPRTATPLQPRASFAEEADALPTEATGAAGTSSVEPDASRFFPLFALSSSVLAALLALSSVLRLVMHSTRPYFPSHGCCGRVYKAGICEALLAR